MKNSLAWAFSPGVYLPLASFSLHSFLSFFLSLPFFFFVHPFGHTALPCFFPLRALVFDHRANWRLTTGSSLNHPFLSEPKTVEALFSVPASLPDQNVLKRGRLIPGCLRKKVLGGSDGTSFDGWSEIRPVREIGRA